MNGSAHTQISERYNGFIKKPKSEENQLGILKIYTFCQKIQQKALGAGQSAAWLRIYLWEYTQKLPLLLPKSWNNFTWWLKKGCNRGIAKVTQLRLVSRLHANTSSPGIYWRKLPNWQAHLELCYRNPDILERVLNQITLSNSTWGSAHPCKV